MSLGGLGVGGEAPTSGPSLGVHGFTQARIEKVLVLVRIWVSEQHQQVNQAAIDRANSLHEGGASKDAGQGQEGGVIDRLTD